MPIFSEFDLDLYRIDILESFKAERIPLDEVIPGLMTSQVGILVAPGGVGKSYFALQLLFQISLGSEINFSLGLKVQSGGPYNVIYLSFEDNKEIISKRLQTIKDFWSSNQLNNDSLTYATSSVHIFSLARSNLRLIDQFGNKTKLYDDVLNKALELKPRIVIIDTLRRSHNCDENNNGSMSNVISHFEILAEKSGSSVLLLHHETKVSTGGTSSSRGASSIVDSVRFMMRMQVMTKLESEKFNFSDDQRKSWVSLSTEKTNYTAALRSFWLKRTERGLLITDTPVLSCSVPKITQHKPKNGGKVYGWQ